MKRNLIHLILLLSFSFHAFAQSTTDAADDAPVEKPNAKRIRRHINLVMGLEHDEELLIPNREINLKGRTEFFDMKRIKGTDFFRMTPKKPGNGIATIHQTPRFDDHAPIFEF